MQLVKKRSVLEELRHIARELIATSDLDQRSELQNDLHDLLRDLDISSPPSSHLTDLLYFIGKDYQVWTELFCTRHPHPLCHSSFTCHVITGANFAV